MKSGNLIPVTLLSAFLLLGSLSCRAAEDFLLKDLAGKPHALADYKGQWVIINFWATWCPPCLEEIPDLIVLHEKRKDVTVIGIAVDYESEKEVRRFVDDNLMSYPVVLGEDKVIRQFGGAEILPTSYIYNPQGKMVRMHRGLITRQQIERMLSGKK